MAELQSLVVTGLSRVVGKIYGLVSRAVSDEKGNRFKDSYIRHGYLTLTNSNISTYYNSSTYVLTIPNTVHTVMFDL